MSHTNFSRSIYSNAITIKRPINHKPDDVRATGDAQHGIPLKLKAAEKCKCGKRKRNHRRWKKRWEIIWLEDETPTKNSFVSPEKWLRLRFIVHYTSAVRTQVHRILCELFAFIFFYHRNRAVPIKVNSCRLERRRRRSHPEEENKKNPN